MSPAPPETSKSYQEVSAKTPQEIKNHEESSAVDSRQPITNESPDKALKKQKQMVANEQEVESLGDGSEEEEESNIYDDPIDLKLRESAKQICDDVYSKVSKKPSEEKNGCNVDEKRKSEMSLSQQEDLMEESLSNAIYASINKAAKKNKEVNLESVTSTMI